MEEQKLPMANGGDEQALLPRFALEDQAQPSKPGLTALRRYLGAVLRFKWLILILTVLGGAAGATLSRYVSMTYESTVMLWVPQPPRAGENLGPIQPSTLLDDNHWVQLMRSFAVLDAVALRLRLYVRHRVEDADVLSSLHVDSVMQPGRYVLQVNPTGTAVELRTAAGAMVERAAVGAPLGRSLGFLWEPPAAALRAGRIVEFEVITPRAASAWLINRVNVQMPPRGSVMTLRFATPDPQSGAAVLNAAADEFVAVATALKRDRVQELRNILEHQLASARVNLETAEYQLNEFLVTTITLPAQPATPVNPGTQETRSGVINSFFALNIERETLQRDMAELERALRPSNDSLSVDALNAIAAVRASPEVSGALEELTAQRAELRALLRTYTPEHPAVRRAAEAVHGLEGEAIPRLGRRLLAEMGTRAATLEQLIASAAHELREIPPRAIEEARYRRNVAVAENLYNDLRQRYENARLATETTTPDVSILSRAEPAQAPVTDRRQQVLLLLLFAGLAAGVGIAILFEVMDGRVRYPEQVREGMRLQILGAVPELGPRRLLNYKLTADRAEQQEALRGIRLNLLHAFGSAGPVMLTVTSPGSGDGKTFTTHNLAVSFAELGMRVLVIDGDVRRGTMHRLLQCTRKPGLTDYLGGTAGLGDVVRMIPGRRIHLIASGTRASNAPELLSSTRMGDLLAAIRGRYDVVLVDSPPLGAGIDPMVLATTTGNVVLVVRTGKTDRGLAEAKLEILDRLPVRVLGAIMNGMTTDVGFRYYSYLHGYEAGIEEPEETERLLQPG